VEPGLRVRIRSGGKRFAEIGGEMASLAAVEALAAELWPGLASAAAALPDPREGERVVLLTEQPGATRAARSAHAPGAAELMVPAGVRTVRAVPLLGSGKADFAVVRRLATAAGAVPEPLERRQRRRRATHPHGGVPLGRHRRGSVRHGVRRAHWRCARLDSGRAGRTLPARFPRRHAAMPTTIPVAAGGFRFVPGVYQYSAGVAAEPGFRIERVRFAEPVPLAGGFARVAAALEAAGRPRSAFCACELRSPEPFTEDGFRAFNGQYGQVLAEWGLFLDGRNPVARSNVCPEMAPSPAPAFHAFCFTVPDAGAAPSFIVAGSGESEEGHGNYRDHTVALGDTSPAGLRGKARYVLDEMERRMAALGFAWADTTAVQAYTVHDVHPFLADELARRGAVRHGLTWQFCRPPVRDLEYEMDCRGIALERVLPVA
jgi:hypothetical protein